MDVKVQLQLDFSLEKILLLHFPYFPSSARPKQKLPSCSHSPRHLQKSKLKDIFCRNDDIKHFTWFTLQQKSAAEIGRWLVHWNCEEQNNLRSNVLVQEPTRCNNNNLLIYKISSTCFAHLQEHKTEIFTAYGIVSCCYRRLGFGERKCGTTFLHTVHIVPRCRFPNPCLPQQDTIP